MKHPTVEDKWDYIETFYASYHSGTARAYFEKFGLLQQDPTARSDECRTVNAIYKSSKFGQKEGRLIKQEAHDDDSEQKRYEPHLHRPWDTPRYKAIATWEPKWKQKLMPG